MNLCHCPDKWNGRWLQQYCLGHSQHLDPDTKPRQHPTTQFFTGRMPFLPPNEQRQSTEGTELQNIIMSSTCQQMTDLFSNYCCFPLNSYFFHMNQGQPVSPWVLIFLLLCLFRKGISLSKHRREYNTLTVINDLAQHFLYPPLHSRHKGRC